jgi:hypothetical protein
MTLVIKFAAGLRPVIKHQEHDQKTHGSWATGVTSELSGWSPKDKVPDGPRNATGTTEKFWDNWEHGVDGDQFVDLYRQYAGEMLGLPVPKSDKDVGGSENYLTQRGFGASSTSAVRNQTEAVLTAIANGRPQPTLYRGMAAGDAESKALLEQFTNLKEGDTIDMPLVSTTRSLGVAQWYAADRSYTPSDTKVILKIQEGAKGVSVNRDKSFYPSDFETITSGKFEVVGITTVTVPYWARSAVHARTFNLNRPGEDVVTGYRFEDPNDSRWYSMDSNDPAAKVRYEIIRDGANTGNFSKIETPTLKYTNDRQTSAVKDGRDITVNSWTQKPPTTFTVIEVKMIEPHTLKKGAELGMIFHSLFNTIPFIRDEEDVIKHAMHDQKTHGSWAMGGSGLGIEEAMALHKSSDPLKQRIYDAEESLRKPSKNKLEKPIAPKWEDYDGIGVPNKGNRDDYDRAHKEYKKKWTAWAVEEQADILSKTGERLLDGSPAGVKKYVEEIITSDWFIERYGDGKSLPTLDVKTSETSEAGNHQLGVVKERYSGRIVKKVHAITINRQFTKDEATILHEISHYATIISQIKPYSGHGVEFAKNHIYVVAQAIGTGYASNLEEAYGSKGIEIGN